LASFSLRTLGQRARVCVGARCVPRGASVRAMDRGRLNLVESLRLASRDRNRQLHIAHRHVCAREITSNKNYNPSLMDRCRLAARCAQLVDPVKASFARPLFQRARAARSLTCFVLLALRRFFFVGSLLWPSFPSSGNSKHTESTCGHAGISAGAAAGIAAGGGMSSPVRTGASISIIIGVCPPVCGCAWWHPRHFPDARVAKANSLRGERNAADYPRRNRRATAERQAPPSRSSPLLKPLLARPLPGAP
jgi:hypothetical protein